MAVRFELTATDPTGARAGILHTRRGSIPTPVFMPVATHAAFRHLSAEDAAATGSRIILGNTYHLMLRPGIEVFQSFKGIHNFMKWDGPVLTDSGGFQIFSMPEDRMITERGAHFRSFHDNSRQLLSPETSVAMQQAINAEIMMVLDVCIDARTDVPGTREAMELTHRWALRSLKQRNAVDTGQALFAIVQGGVHRGLRNESAAFLTDHPFDGFAIGGLAVGESKADREGMTEHTTALLPKDKPRYLMGVGRPADIVGAVKRGIDMFDCVMPTRAGRTAQGFTRRGEINLRNARHRDDPRPIDEQCACPACRHHSRAYLHHLIRSEEILGAMLLTWHNLHYYQDIMRGLRGAIEGSSLEPWIAAFESEQALGDIAAN